MEPMDWRDVGERLEGAEEIDRLAAPLHRVVERWLPAGWAKDALQGGWLGHALHPLLTDLPIGFWTSSWVLDIVGGRESRAAADALVGFGVLSALPTAASGLADWTDLSAPVRRVGAVHAAANVTATVVYAASWAARRRGRRGTGIALGMVGAVAATLGGHLGGDLVYRRAAGVDPERSR